MTEKIVVRMGELCFVTNQFLCGLVYFGRVGLRNIAGSNSWSASEFEFTTTYKIPEVAVVGMVCLVNNQKANAVGFESPHHTNININQQQNERQ